MRLGLVTYNVARGWDIETIIEKLEAARFEAVELRSTHRHGVEPGMPRREIERVRDRFARSKVRLLSLGSACEFHSPDAAARQANIDETQGFVELAHDLGCWGVKVRPNGLPDDVPEKVTIRRIGEALQTCGEIGARYGVEIWVEVHGNKTREPERMQAIMDACGHENVGICWNCNPSDIRGGSIRAGFDLLKAHIRNVHLRDLPDYPHGELFGLLRGIGYERYTLVETQESCEPDRYLKYYRALWDELVRAA